MRSIVRSYWSQAVARVLVLAMAVPLGLAPAAGAQQGVAVLVVPLENKTQTGGDELAARVTDAVKMALEGSGRAAVVAASESSPSAKRAVEQERTLSAEDLRPPWDAEKARRVGRALGADVALMGTIEEYSFDEAAKRVTIALSIQRIDVNSEQAPVSIGVTGRSADRPRPPAKEGTLMAEALDDVAVKVAEAVVGGGAVAKVAEKPKAPRKSRTRKWLLPLLAVAAAIAIFSGDHGGPAAPARVTTPITDPYARALEGGVGLSWGVRSGTPVPEGFNIYRAPAGTATLGGEDILYRAPFRPRSRQAVSGPYEKIANVAGTGRAMTDTTVAPGQLYAYQIRALVAGKETSPVDFKNAYELPTDTVVVGPGVPIAPRGVTIVPGPGSLSATVRWQPNPETFVTGYRVYRGTTPSTFYLLGQFSSSTTQHDDFRNLQANKTYYYIVSALGGTVGGKPIESSTGPIQFTVVQGPLSPPSNLQATAGQDFISLSWTPSPDPAVQGYNIYRNGTKIASVAGRETHEYTNTGLQPNTQYTYFLRSFDGTSRESANSNSVTAHTAAPPASVTCSADKTTILANGVDKSIIGGLVRDANANPIPGVTVVFRLVSGSGTLEIAPGSGGVRVDPNTIEAPTQANGVASVALKAPDTVPGVPSHVSATVKGTTITCSIDITIVAPTPATLELTAIPTSVIADGHSQSVLTALVKDASGVGVEAINVHFTIDNPSLGVLSHTDKVTDAQGRAIIRVTSAAANAIGTARVTATASGKTASVTITFIAQPSLTVSVNPATIPAGGIGSTALITATVKAADGSPVPGQVVHFAFNEPGAPTRSQTGATIAPDRSNSDSAGLAFSTLTSPPDLTHGTSDVILVWMDTNANGVFDTLSDRWAIVGITYTDPPASVTVTADPTSIPADMASTSRITADVRTAIPNPIGPGFQPVANGTRVEFTTTGGVFTSTGTNSATAFTVDGLASVLLRASTTAGTYTVTATAASVSGSTTVQFTVVAAGLLSVSADPASIPANGTATSTITARLRDSQGNPIANQQVTFATTLGQIDPAQAPTDAQGQAVSTLTAGREAGTATIRATSGSLQATTQVFLTGAAPARIDAVLVDPGILPATGGVSSPSGVPVTTTVYTRVTDQFGNAVQDGTPVLFQTDVGTITAQVPTTGGEAVATIVPPTFWVGTNHATFSPGIGTIVAYAGSLTGPRSVELHPVFAGDLSFYTTDGGDNGTNLVTSGGADWRLGIIGQSQVGIEIEAVVCLRDANDNNLPTGVPIEWEVAYSNQKITGTSPTYYCPFSDCVIAKFRFTLTSLGTPPVSGVRAKITARVPGIATAIGGVQFYVFEDIGAGDAATIEAPTVPDVVIDAVTCTGGTTVRFRNIKDVYGNFVQNGTLVDFTYENPVNMSSVVLAPPTGSTSAGDVSVFVSGTTTKDSGGNCQAGSIVLVARPRTTQGAAPEARVTINFRPPA